MSLVPNNLLLQVGEYIKSHLNEDLSVASLCKHFHITRTVLQERFKAFHSLPIHTYILRLRMEKARDMLIETDESIKLIAIECGYRNARSFLKAFKKMWNETPEQFRSLQRKLHRNKSSLLVVKS